MSHVYLEKSQASALSSLLLNIYLSAQYMEDIILNKIMMIF